MYFELDTQEKNQQEKATLTSFQAYWQQKNHTHKKSLSCIIQKTSKGLKAKKKTPLLSHTY